MSLLGHVLGVATLLDDVVVLVVRGKLLDVLDTKLIVLTSRSHTYCKCIAARLCSRCGTSIPRISRPRTPGRVGYLE